VPEGNSPEKNAAMQAFGAELRMHGADFDAAREQAMRMATQESLFPVPPFHRELVRGVATYAYEMFMAKPDLHTVYVPIGCGSGICGVIAARDALGLATRVVGVVSDAAQTAKLSVAAGALVPTDTARTFADGMAVRVPVAEALAIYAAGAERIITVTDAEVADAIRIYHTDTHNLAEGAGAAPLAGLMQDRAAMAGRDVGVILCGGNIDADVLRIILAGGMPQV
jgi:threonine dehydratase